MSDCIKPFTLKVNPAGPPPLAWWKMEEPSTNDRIDAVNSIHLINTFLFNATPSNPFAKVNRGMQTVTIANAQGYNSQWEGNPAVPSSWLGFQFCCWARWDTWSDLLVPDNKSLQWILNQTQLNYTDFSGAEQLQLQFYYNASNLIFAASDSASGDLQIITLPFTPLATTWYFLSMFHDPANHLIGISINDGAAITHPFTSSITGHLDSLDVQMQINNGNPNPTTPAISIFLDEYAIFTSKLSSSDLTFLYNSGAGRTYPYA